MAFSPIMYQASALQECTIGQHSVLYGSCKIWPTILRNQAAAATNGFQKSPETGRFAWGYVVGGPDRIGRNGAETGAWRNEY